MERIINDSYSNNNEKLILAYIEIITEIAFAIDIFVTIVLVYNRILYLQGKKTIFDTETSRNLFIIIRILTLIIHFSYIYIYYQSYKSSRSKADYIGLMAAVIAMIPVSMLLYSLFLEYTEDEDTAFNPEH